MEKNPTMWRKLKRKVIQSEEFNMKECRCYNVSVLINLHQNLEKMLPMFNEKQNKGGNYIYREMGVLTV